MIHKCGFKVHILLLWLLCLLVFFNFFQNSLTKLPGWPQTFFPTLASWVAGSSLIFYSPFFFVFPFMWLRNKFILSVEFSMLWIWLIVSSWYCLAGFLIPVAGLIESCFVFCMGLLLHNIFLTLQMKGDIMLDCFYFKVDRSVGLGPGS